jgi:L-lysine 6-oxidase
MRRRREAVVGKDVRSIEWTVHLASKKAAWYNFSELEGDLLSGPDNSYKARKVSLRNSTVKGADRQDLLIDFGPRRLSGPGARSDFTKDSVPKGYPARYPKKPPHRARPLIRWAGRWWTRRAA